MHLHSQLVGSSLRLRHCISSCMSRAPFKCLLVSSLSQGYHGAIRAVVFQQYNQEWREPLQYLVYVAGYVFAERNILYFCHFYLPWFVWLRPNEFLLSVKCGRLVSIWEGHRDSITIASQWYINVLVSVVIDPKGLCISWCILNIVTYSDLAVFSLMYVSVASRIDAPE